MDTETQIEQVNNEDILIRQKHFPMGLFSVWMMVLTTIQWIQLDMYLPALPVIREEFGVSEAYLNITLNAGIVACAVGTFIGGMLSDRYGRKPIMLIGLVSSAACAFIAGFSEGVLMMSIMRALGNLGGGFVLTVILAVIKDSYSGGRFNKIMTTLQAVAAVGPVVAPSIGSALINLMSWRLIFFFLGALITVSAIPIFFMSETWPKDRRILEGFGSMLRNAGTIISDKGFLLFMGVMSFLTIPTWAYISVSSYVYVNTFGMSNTAYGLLYAVNAIVSIIGPFLYLVLCRHTSVRRTVAIIICILALGAVIMLTGAPFDPFIFLAGVIPIVIAEAMIRPLGTVVLLDENPESAGTVSAWIQFIVNLSGIIGTTLATLAWSSMVIGLGVITGGSVLFASLCWGLILKGKLIRIASR